jgi:hypothetical protein
MITAALVGLLFSATPQVQVRENLICEREDGYAVTRVYVLLPEGLFTQEGMIGFFSRLETRPGETYAIATSDRKLFEELVNPRWQVVPHWAPTEPLIGSAPYAYYFRLKGVSVVQLLDAEGKAGWIVLDGENPFRRSFGDSVIEWIGHGFRSIHGTTECDRANHTLVFHASDLKDDALIGEILSYYDDLFEEPFLALDFWEDKSTALRYPEIRLPSLDYLSCFGGGDQPAFCGGKGRNVVSYRRDLFPGRSLMIWRDGELVVDRRWER